MSAQVEQPLLMDMILHIIDYEFSTVGKYMILGNRRQAEAAALSCNFVIITTFDKSSPFPQARRSSP